MMALLLLRPFAPHPHQGFGIGMETAPPFPLLPLWISASPHLLGMTPPADHRCPQKELQEGTPHLTTHRYAAEGILLPALFSFFCLSAPDFSCPLPCSCPPPKRSVFPWSTPSRNSWCVSGRSAIAYSSSCRNWWTMSTISMSSQRRMLGTAATGRAVLGGGEDSMPGIRC